MNMKMEKSGCMMKQWRMPASMMTNTKNAYMYRVNTHAGNAHALYCTALHCTALMCTVHCIVQGCNRVRPVQCPVHMHSAQCAVLSAQYRLFRSVGRSVGRSVWYLVRGLRAPRPRSSPRPPPARPCGGGGRRRRAACIRLASPCQRQRQCQRQCQCQCRWKSEDESPTHKRRASQIRNLICGGSAPADKAGN